MLRWVRNNTTVRKSRHAGRRVLIHKGDKPGHPFRGNQWTTGGGKKRQGAPTDGATAETKQTVPEWASDSQKEMEVVDLEIRERKLLAQQQDYVDELSDDQASDIEVYTSSGYRDVNRVLRGQSPPPSGDVAEMSQERGEMVNDAIVNAPPLTEDVVVHRGVLLGAFGVEDDLEDVGEMDRQAQSLVGKTFVDKGIVSTSLSKYVAAGFTPGGGHGAGDGELVIRVPAGSKALALGSLTRMRGEFEVVLPRNTEFTIVSVVGTGAERVIYVEAKTP